MEFYEQLLSQTAQAYRNCSTAHAVFSLAGGLVLEFLAHAPESKAQAYAAVAAHLSVEVSDIETTLKGLMECGFIRTKVAAELHRGDVPHRLAVIADPDGRQVTLVQILT